MASIEEGVRSILLANSGVTDLISTRVFPWLRQQGTSLPAVVYTLDNTEPQQSLGGYDGLTRASLTINSIADRYGDAKSLASAVRTALNGYTGTPTNGHPIKSLVHDNDTGIVEDSAIGNDRGVSIIESEYIIWYSS